MDVKLIAYTNFGDGWSRLDRLTVGLKDGK